MPLEVTPVPFVEQQLPYNPKFIREPEASQNGEGSLQGGAGGSAVSGPGPFAVAASALIPPTPGGIAGPHNAIPALPDAGYTAPGIRTTGLGLDIGGGSSARSSLSDGYGPMGPASMMRPGAYAASGFAPDAFGQMPRGPPPVPMSTISSHSWVGGGQNTFPGPRRASNPALVPSLAESTIAPRGVSQHVGQAIDPRHQQLEVPVPHGHHHSHRHRRSVSGARETRSEADDWDARSDASYYARPKPNRARSGSTLSDITTSTSTARPPPAHHHYSLHQGQKGSPGQHEHSPISPSPLARDGPPHHRVSHSQPGPSPLSPTAHVGTRHGRKISGVDTGGRGDGGGDGALPPPQASPYRRVTPFAPDLDFAPGDLTTLRETSERGGRRYSTSYGSDGGYEPSRRRMGSPHGYASDDEGRYSSRSRGARREKSRHRHDDGVSSHHSPSRRGHKHVAEAYPNDEYDGHQHQHRSHSRVPPPMQYRPPSPPRNQQQLMPDIASLSISGEPRQRAHSMQAPAGLPVSSPASLAGFGGGAAYAAGPYQTPSVAGGGEVYDDGGSIAGSAMTFMDGTVAGRTSHYGLPKYPHQAKPDYRRFMVQRGKADVYLD